MGGQDLLGLKGRHNRGRLNHDEHGYAVDVGQPFFKVVLIADVFGLDVLLMNPGGVGARAVEQLPLGSHLGDLVNHVMIGQHHRSGVGQGDGKSGSRERGLNHQGIGVGHRVLFVVVTQAHPTGCGPVVLLPELELEGVRHADDGRVKVGCHEWLAVVPLYTIGEVEGIGQAVFGQLPRGAQVAREVKHLRRVGLELQNTVKQWPGEESERDPGVNPVGPKLVNGHHIKVAAGNAHLCRRGHRSCFGSGCCRHHRRGSPCCRYRSHLTDCGWLCGNRCCRYVGSVSASAGDDEHQKRHKRP